MQNRDEINHRVYSLQEENQDIEDNQFPEEIDLLNPPSLVDWKNPPKLKDLKNDLEEAKPSHDTQVSKITTWLNNLNTTNNNKINNIPKGNSRIQPKLIRKQAEWRYSSLSEPFLSTDDIFNVSPVTWEDKDAAIQNELVLSYQFNSKIDKTAFIDEYVRTVVDEGTAIIRVGWEYEEEEYLKEQPIVEFFQNPELEQLHQELEQLRTTSPSQYDTDVPEELKQAHALTLQHGVPIEGRIIGTKQVPDIKIIKNQPTIEVCNNQNIIVDPTCNGDLDKASFIIYSFEASFSDLEKDGRYSNLNYINSLDDSVLNVPDHFIDSSARNFTFKDKPRKKLAVYEYWGYWDIHGTGIVKPIVAAWVNNTIIRLEENPYPDKKLPFIAVQYLPVRKSIYGEPDGELLKENQDIIGAVTRGMVDIMGRSANGQVGVRKDALDVVNRRKFDRGLDYEFNPHVDPRQAVYMHTYPEIPNSAQFMLQLQNMEAESLTGVKAFSQGISQNSLGNVATSVRGALDAASKRELGILRRLSAGIIKIGKKIISMNAAFLSEEEVVRVTNDNFITVRRDALQGDFDLRLSISTAEEDDNKAQELSFMLQTVGNTLSPELSQIILADIARLRKMPDLANTIKNYAPQPDERMQQMQELEMQLVQAKIQNQTAQAEYYRGTANLNVAKAATEEVKQDNLQSDTDLKDLNFVEQESGVQQERELERRKAQAESQAKLKLIDNELKDKQGDKSFLKEYLMKQLDNKTKESIADKNLQAKIGKRKSNQPSNYPTNLNEITNTSGLEPNINLQPNINSLGETEDLDIPNQSQGM